MARHKTADDVNDLHGSDDDEVYDDETTDCDCWEYEHIDPLTGCATCGRCGSRRYLSSEQMREIERLQAEYDEAMERDNT